MSSVLGGYARLGLVAASLVIALAGCSADGNVDRGGGGAGNGGNLLGNGGTFAGSTGGSGFGGSGMNGGGGGAGPDALPPGRVTEGATALPCNVRDVLKNSCQSCHAAMPLQGVPMALVSWEDTQKPSVSNPAVSVHDMMKMRIHDATKPMPPTGMLGADQLAIVDAWLDGGAIAGTDPTCKPPDPRTYYGGEMPPDVENCYEVHAHANSVAGDTTPLTSSGEHYATFYFDAPWPVGSQAVYFETLPGDHPEILHHWLIYSEDNGNQPDGHVDYPALGTHPSAPTLIAGWAPGSNNNDIPSDVGLQLDGPNRKMSMEIHFFGAEGVPFPTTAGVKICTVEKNLRPNTATTSWLGTELGINIPPRAQDSVAMGICTPVNQTGDIHVLRSWPHMHLMGKHMESTVIRKDGSREVISPDGGWPFDFNNEVSFKTEYVLHPGDTVETKCHYTSDKDVAVQVGFENRYEMCFNFTLAYPAKALVNRGFAGSTSLTNSATACLY